MTGFDAKPRLSRAELSRLLEPWGSADSIGTMAEGEDSQTALLHARGRRFVLRVNASRDGFLKDDYAATRFGSLAVPIPVPDAIFQAPCGLWCCVTPYVEGPTLQDLPETGVRTLLPAVNALLAAIHGCPPPGPGYGELGPEGSAPASSWNEWLLSQADPERWHSLSHHPRYGKRVSLVLSAYRELVPAMPNLRALVHGDFGSNNVIAGPEGIRAVLDWDASAYGDPLFDLAGTFYWAVHLPCMAIHARHALETTAEEDFALRIRCYALRAALTEMSVHWARADTGGFRYHLERGTLIAKSDSCEKLIPRRGRLSALGAGKEH